LIDRLAPWKTLSAAQRVRGTALGMVHSSLLCRAALSAALSLGDKARVQPMRVASPFFDTGRNHSSPHRTFVTRSLRPNLRFQPGKISQIKYLRR